MIKGIFVILFIGVYVCVYIIHNIYIYVYITISSLNGPIMLLQLCSTLL